MNIQRAGGGCHRLDLALAVQLDAGGRLGLIHDTGRLQAFASSANQGMLCLQTPTSPFLSFVLQL